MPKMRTADINQIMHLKKCTSPTQKIKHLLLMILVRIQVKMLGHNSLGYNLRRDLENNLLWLSQFLQDP